MDAHIYPNEQDHHDRVTNHANSMTEPQVASSDAINIETESRAGLWQRPSGATPGPGAAARMAAFRAGAANQGRYLKFNHRS